MQTWIWEDELGFDSQPSVATGKVFSLCNLTTKNKKMSALSVPRRMKLPRVVKWTRLDRWAGRSSAEVGAEARSGSRGQGTSRSSRGGTFWAERTANAKILGKKSACQSGHRQREGWEGCGERDGSALQPNRRVRVPPLPLAGAETCRSHAQTPCDPCRPPL